MRGLVTESHIIARCKHLRCDLRLDIRHQPHCPTTTWKPLRGRNIQNGTYVFKMGKDRGAIQDVYVVW